MSCFASRSRFIALLICGLGSSAATIAACGGNGDEPPAASPAAERKLRDIPWDPQFPPDINTLKPKPGVEAATPSEQKAAVVRADSVEFPASDAPTVRDWQPGRIVASGASGANNPLGYARRVVSVETVGDKIVVQTEPVGIADLFEGELRVRGDTNGTDLDISGLDLKWVEETLYPGVAYPPPKQASLKDDPRLSDDAAGAGGSGLCCGLDGLLRPNSAAASVQKKMAEVPSKTRESELEGMVATARQSGSLGGLQSRLSLDSDISIVDFDQVLFRDWEFKKQLHKRVPLEIFMKGSASARGKLTINPGFQMWMVAQADKGEHWWSDVVVRAGFGMAIDTRIYAMFGLKAQLEAGLRGADIGTGFLKDDQLEKAIEKGSDAIQNALNDVREDLFGNKDSKPEGTVVKTLWRSMPKVINIQAGPVPVVLTASMQLDLICNFEAKASINTDLQIEQISRLRYEVIFDPFGSPQVKSFQPTYEGDRLQNVEVLGGGSITAGCSLAPRVNGFVYDGVGIYTGARVGLIGEASFESKCHETRTRPKGEVNLALKASAGLFFGARAQIPGSSFLGTKGVRFGVDTPMIEPFNEEWPLITKTFDIENGFGYCTPLCQNRRLDGEGSGGKETDVDCGGGSCNACADGQACANDSDCAGAATCNNGRCIVSPCNNSRTDGQETDMDCGGTCPAKCAVARSCVNGTDCASGFCSMTTRKCVASSCEDGVQSGNETGKDCGGSCAKCALNAFCRVDADCASGFSNGVVCVANSCEDGRQSGSETGVDCGGSNSCRRCGVGVRCAADTDCQAGYSCTNATCRAIAQASCSDRIQNQNETKVDCGGVCPACPATVAILLAGGVGGAFGTSFQSGAWTPVQNVGPDMYQQGGGGLLTTPAGQGYSVFRPGGGNELLRAWWTGSWPTSPTVIGTVQVNYVSAPALAGTRMFSAVAEAGGQILFNAFDFGTSAWTTLGEATGAGDFNSKPAIAPTAGGDPVIAFPTFGGTYSWTKRTGTTWSSAATVPGITLTGGYGEPSIPVILKRQGADEIFGFFYGGSATSPQAMTTVFSGGSWSAPSSIASDLQSAVGPDRNLSACAFPDGRIALAYVATGRTVKVAILSGTTWGAFTTVPGVTVASGTPVSIAPGTSNATLELVYVDSDNAIRHTRLTGSTWSAPVMIDNTRIFNSVALATY